VYGDLLEYNVINRPVFGSYWYSLHRLKSRIGTIDHLPKDGILSVEMRLLAVSDEELGFVGIWAGVGHCYDATPIELESGANLIFEWPPPETLTTLSGVSGITSLDHERLDVSVEERPIIIPARAESKKVLRSLGSCFAEDFNLELTVGCLESD